MMVEIINPAKNNKVMKGLAKKMRDRVGHVTPISFIISAILGKKPMKNNSGMNNKIASTVTRLG